MLNRAAADILKVEGHSSIRYRLLTPRIFMASYVLGLAERQTSSRGAVQLAGSRQWGSETPIQLRYEDSGPAPAKAHVMHTRGVIWVVPGPNFRCVAAIWLATSRIAAACIKVFWVGDLLPASAPAITSERLRVAC
jgi:hypothetical protein